jgi:cytochrome c biogenesis protein CcmG, thiol:disulfide interchange protein DsbE
LKPLINLCILVTIISLTLLYSFYQKQHLSYLETPTKEYILERLPSFNAVDVFKNEKISTELLQSKKYPGLVVHFWGTWCAPCEAELPTFIAFAAKLKHKGVKFILLAVNDKVAKIKKFFTKHKITIPNNVMIALDNSTKSMPIFGTAKVPETYLFDSNLNLVKKYTGPQEWIKPSYMNEFVSHL